MTKTPYESSVTCPHCGVQHIAYSEIEDSDKRPRAGDICICNKCAGVAEYKIFAGHIELVKADQERVFKDFDPEQIKQIHLIRQQIMSQNDARPACN